MSSNSKYLKSEIAVMLIVLGTMLFAIVVPADGGRGSSAQPSATAMLRASGRTQTTVRDGRFHLTFLVATSGVALDWLTPTIEPLAGLGGLDVYLVPPGTPGVAPDAVLASRSLDRIPAATQAMIVVTGLCVAAPAPQQAVRVVVEARVGATMTSVPILPEPIINARDLLNACLAGSAQ